MKTNNERGIALVLALFLMTAMSVLAASLMFLSQTETYASMNYRMMSQARYAAEAGIQRASNFLLDSTQYAVPGTVTDPLSNYVTTVSPVTYNGQPVVLSTTAGSSNYPVAAVVTAFGNAAKGTLTAGNTTLSYATTATLVAMQKFEAYGGTQGVVQTWQIVADGTLSGSRNATVEVMTTIETPMVPANTYAAFATANTCGAMYFHGNVTVDSYDSQGLTGAPSLTFGGNVGTNGNLEIQGSVDVKGTLSTPRTGVGACTQGAVTALTEIGSADVRACSGCSTTDSIIKLPKAVTWPLPVFSATPPTSTVTLTTTAIDATHIAGTCTSLGLTYGTTCKVSGSTIIIDGLGSDVTLPNVVMSGVNVQFEGGPSANPVLNVNINSLTGSGTVVVDTNTGATTNQAVVLKIAGKNPDGTDMATPIDLESTGWKQNAANGHQYDASAFQIVYGGTGTLNMDGGNAQTAASIYAPNATFYLKGTQDLYGSVLAKTIENAGNASLHYDRRLSRDFHVAGQPMAGTFTWKRY